VIGWQTLWIMGEREARLAKNEAATREMNEQIEQAHPKSPNDYFRIVCECGTRDTHG
jgi:hypothetical protein